MISIIIATHNGAPTLARTLEALTTLEAPDTGFEVIVADNGSTDSTPTVIESFLDRLPLTLVHDARRGKSYALNTALETARGDFLIFIDDDVICAPDFLRAYEAVAAAHPDQSVFTGQIRLTFNATPPDWLVQLGEAGLAYASTHVDRTEGSMWWLAAQGPNMAARRSAIGDVRFRTDPATNYTGPGTGTGGGDSWFAHDIAQGGDIWFTQAPCVHHIVRAPQNKISTIFDRYRRIGLTSYALDPDTEALYRPTALGVPVPLMSRMAKACVGGLYRLVRRDKEAAARRMLDFALNYGKLQSLRRAKKA